MAGKFGSASAFLYVDGYDLLGAKVKELRYKVEAINEDTTGLGDTFKNKLPVGVSILTVVQGGGFFDTAANGAHTALSSVVSSPQATPRIITLGFGGAAVGNPFTGAEGAFSSAYEVLSKVNELTKANPTYAVAGQVDQGVLLRAMAAATGNVTGTGVDNLAASTNGGAAVLQVTAYSGFTSAAIVVADSADNSSFSTIASFASVTSGPQAQRVAIAGTIRRYTRYQLTVVGSGSITFGVGVARG